jgi:fructose-bisphosphate aldolase class II
VALHTDHCPKDALPGFVLPLIEASEAEVKAGRNPIFQSHMWDGSAVPLAENLEIAKELLPRMKAINAILEVEIGVVGGEEDGVSHDINEHLYTTLDDVIQTVDALGFGEQGRYIAALTFGNVHGVYKPGNVRLKPELLGEIQAGIAAKYGTAAKPLDLVFHGGSGSTDEEIATAVANGVVKMNIDTDTQYAFSRSIADTVLRNYDGFLKVDGEVGNKKIYDPRAWGKIAETAMAKRVIQATQQLGSAGHSAS